MERAATERRYLEAQLNEEKNRRRIAEGGCTLCSCYCYDYNFGNTISDAGRASIPMEFAKIFLHTATIYTTHIAGDNRCDC